MELTDRNVVITGAGSGIGAALARRFAAENPRSLVLADLNLDNVQAVAEQVGGTALQTDVGQPAEIEALVARAREVGGPVDVFFSNAGIPGPDGGPPEASDEAWDQAWRVNVMAHVWAARALLPEMLERRDGYLLSTASAAGILTQVGALVYSVTKHAAVAVAEWLNINYAHAGIKVSCLCPLGVRTPMLELALEDKVGSAALMQDELLEPEDVAEAVVDGIRAERLLIFPHPQLSKYMTFKASDNERWLAGMKRMVARARTNGREAS
ncbi:MAG TPA: SDR family NAD(P)-dependent oxidoreductase [Solirubrobacteraceae bacterium]|jgi:NAD(P)-dependent dehydrogenase (short-subunit alcohol dehydrogenase family)|nr:SDR family NAD(P)-dependent oxidoreductase [Solirubrobacteraceae bacterium]